jgi:hypothetical protein
MAGASADEAGQGAGRRWPWRRIGRIILAGGMVHGSMCV